LYRSTRLSGPLVAIGAAPRWGKGTGRKMRRGRGINKPRIGDGRTWSWIGARAAPLDDAAPRSPPPLRARRRRGRRVSGSGTGCRGGGHGARRAGGGEGRANRSPTHGYEIRPARHATFPDTRARVAISGRLSRRGASPVSHDLRIALRTLLKRPLFTAVGVLTIGLGIAASVTVYSVVDAVLLEPLPYADPGRLVSVWEHNIPRGNARNVVSPAHFLVWREQPGEFQDVAAAIEFSVTLTGAGEAERVGNVRSEEHTSELQ